VELLLREAAGLFSFDILSTCFVDFTGLFSTART
jgi:hypothetical protein